MQRYGGNEHVWKQRVRLGESVAKGSRMSVREGIVERKECERALAALCNTAGERIEASRLLMGS